MTPSINDQLKKYFEAKAPEYPVHGGANISDTLGLMADEEAGIMPDIPEEPTVPDGPNDDDNVLPLEATLAAINNFEGDDLEEFKRQFPLGSIVEVPWLPEGENATVQYMPFRIVDRGYENIMPDGKEISERHLSVTFQSVRSMDYIMPYSGSLVVGRMNAGSIKTSGTKVIVRDTSDVYTVDLSDIKNHLNFTSDEDLVFTVIPSYDPVANDYSRTAAYKLRIFVLTLNRMRLSSYLDRDFSKVTSATASDSDIEINLVDVLRKAFGTVDWSGSVVNAYLNGYSEFHWQHVAVIPNYDDGSLSDERYFASTIPILNRRFQECLIDADSPVLDYAARREIPYLDSSQTPRTVLDEFFIPTVTELGFHPSNDTIPDSGHAFEYWQDKANKEDLMRIIGNDGGVLLTRTPFSFYDPDLGSVAHDRISVIKISSANYGLPAPIVYGMYPVLMDDLRTPCKRGIISPTFVVSQGGRSLEGDGTTK